MSLIEIVDNSLFEFPPLREKKANKHLNSISNL